MGASAVALSMPVGPLIPTLKARPATIMHVATAMRTQVQAMALELDETRLSTWRMTKKRRPKR